MNGMINQKNKQKSWINNLLIFIFISLIIAATALRLYQLDIRPFHHDEAAVGSFTYKLFTTGNYQYTPVFHGPFLYFITSRVFDIMGDTEFSARLVPALTGVGMVLLVYPFRQNLGSPGWLITAAFFAFSPSFLYYSRFFRNDIFITFFTLAAVVCTVQYLKQKDSPARLKYLVLSSASLGCSVTAKENAYITLALFAFPVGLFVLYRLGVSLRNHRLAHDVAVFMKRNSFRLVLDTGLFIIVFLVIFILFYSYFFKDLEAVKCATFNALSHWYEMHNAERIGGPPYYYIPLLLLYELPVFLFASVGSFVYVKRFVTIRENPIMVFIVYWLFASLAAYSYVGEKVPWLILHPLLPAILIAGAYLGEILPVIKYKPVWKEAVFVIILVLISSFFLYTSYNLNYRNYSDPAELLIQASQPPQKYQEFITTLYEVAEKHEGFATEIQVADREMETQLLWYLRHYTQIRWRVNLENDPQLNAPIIIAHDLDADYVENMVDDTYQRLDSARMAWYFPKLTDINYRFIMYRWMDRPQSEYGVVLFYR